METSTFLFILLIGFFIFKRINKDNKKNRTTKNNNRNTVSGYANNQIQQTSRRNNSRNTQLSQVDHSLIKNAQNLVARKNYDQATNLYLRAGQVYTAAKTNMLKGPHASNEAIELIKLNAPEQYNKILNNLVEDFYNRQNKPEIAAALLRSAGFIDRASAIEIASNIQPVVTTNTVVAPTVVQTAPSANTLSNVSKPVEQKFDLDEIEPVSDNELDSFLDDQIATKEVKPISKDSQKTMENIPNGLMMAPQDMKQKCMVCRKIIKAGDTFIYCIHCGKPGHYRDFGEMMKVTGKCPSCKERLNNAMYDLN